MVRAASHRTIIARLDEAEAKIRKPEAEAEMQGRIFHELVAETGATQEQIVAASLRACGLPVNAKDQAA